MSIASEITRLQGAKNTLKTKLNAKNDAQHQITNETIEEYGDFVDSISSGGGDTSDATALQSDILSSKTAYIATGKVTGSMANNGALSYTPGDNAITIPAGYTSGGTISAVDITTLSDYSTCLALTDRILNGGMPDGTELVYVRGTGTQYINTNINTGQNSQFSYDVKFKLNAVTNDASILGLNKRLSSLSILSGYITVNNVNIASADTNLHELKYNRSTGEVIYDGVQHSITTSISETEYGNIHVFKRSGSSSSFVNMDLYSLKIYNSNKSELKMNLIPAKRTNNTVCFYDTVTGTYFYNAGTGTFVAGPAVEEG